MYARACVLELVELELDARARAGFFKTRVELLDSIFLACIAMKLFLYILSTGGSSSDSFYSCEANRASRAWGNAYEPLVVLVSGCASLWLCLSLVVRSVN